MGIGTPPKGGVQEIDFGLSEDDERMRMMSGNLIRACSCFEAEAYVASRFHVVE